MNEQDWLSSVDPQAMMQFLGSVITERKKRLFEIACCAALVDLLEYPESERAIALAAQQTDEAVAADEIDSVTQQADEA